MLFLQQNYLRAYHYISPTRSGNHDFETAVRKFQHFMNLPVTGQVDRATLNMMRKPRCGVPDVEDGAFESRKRRYSTFGSKWSKTHLTYYLQHGQDLPQATQERVIKRALQYWSEVSPLTFSRINDANNADLKMRWNETIKSKVNLREDSAPFPFTSASKRVFVWNHSNMSSAYRFIFMPIKLTFIKDVLHADSLWYRGR